MRARNVALIALCLCQTPTLAGPVTYQGRLDQGGAPADGFYDLRFDLYDDRVPGAPDNLIESEILLGVRITNGLFTVEIPFNTFSFDLGPRFIEIGVRSAGGGAYTTLSPREEVTEAPLATYSTRASSLDLPVSMGAAPAVVNAPVLEISNIGASGSAIRGIGPDAGLIGHAGSLAGVPIVALAPAGVQGLGELTGVSGASGAGVGIIGASASGSGGEFVATTTGNSLWAHNAGTGIASLIEIDNSNSTSPALLARTVSTRSSAYAVHALIESASPGGFSAAVRAENRGTLGNGIGLHASHDGSGWGVLGESPNGVGVRATTVSGTAGEFAVAGASNSGIPLHAHTAGTGLAALIETDNPNSAATTLLVRSASTQANTEVIHSIVESNTPGDNTVAVRGQNNGTGFFGIGLWGSHAGSGTGVYATTSAGVALWALATGGGDAGLFIGDVFVSGNLSKSSGSFKIDHPLDPANKYLSHSFVESPDMKNIYDGVVTLDDDGRAVVTLPDYFDALNEDFRYQLTCIGGYAQVYIEREISENTFAIAGGRPGLRVSWQVTGARKDAYAKDHPIVVEVEKSGDDRGRYLYPEGFGAQSQDAIGRRPLTN